MIGQELILNQRQTIELVVCTDPFERYMRPRKENESLQDIKDSGCVLIETPAEAYWQYEEQRKAVRLYETEMIAEANWRIMK